MKGCPVCNRTFEDSMSFCLADGSILSAPFVLYNPSVPVGETRPADQRTVILPIAESGRGDLPPTEPGVILPETIPSRTPPTVQAEAEGRANHSRPTLVQSKRRLWTRRNTLLIAGLVTAAALAVWWWYHFRWTAPTRSPTEVALAFNHTCKKKDVQGYKRTLNRGIILAMEKSAKVMNLTLDQYVAYEFEHYSCAGGDIQWVGDEVIDGDRATVHVTTSNGPETWTFIKEDREWRFFN